MRLRVLALFICLLLLPLQSHAALRSLPSVTVLAASSLTNVLTELASTYSRERNVTISTSYEASGYLASEIIAGESADIFISAHPSFVTDLKQRGLLDVFNIKDIAKNRLVITASPELHIRSKISQEDIDNAGVFRKLQGRAIPVIADASESALGIYTEQSLTALKQWDNIQSYAIRAANARRALYLIAKGKTFGITYLTDAANNPEVEILSTLPDTLHEPIIYQASVVAGENMEQARLFLHYLTSPNAKKIWRKYQFIVE